MPRPIFVSVNGTGAPDPYAEGLTFPGDLGRFVSDPWNDIYAEFIGPQVANKFDWRPVGYPAAVFPMGPSYREGVNNTVGVIQNSSAKGTKIVFSGYSQGALVTSTVWRDEFLKPSGRLHERLGDVVGIVNFGDPMRAPGLCNGNLRAGFPVPGTLNGYTTGGIAGPNDLKPEETPDFLLSCNNPGDLYGTAPVGDTPWLKETGVGHDETMIYNLVQDFDGKNLLAFVTEIGKILGVTFAGGLDLMSLITTAASAIGGAFGPMAGIPGLTADGIKTESALVSVVMALLNGGMFILSGLGPHGDYGKMIPAMIDFILSRA